MLITPKPVSLLLVDEDNIILDSITAFDNRGSISLVFVNEDDIILNSLATFGSSSLLLVDKDDIILNSLAAFDNRGSTSLFFVDEDNIILNCFSSGNKGGRLRDVRQLVRNEEYFVRSTYLRSRSGKGASSKCGDKHGGDGESHGC